MNNKTVKSKRDVILNSAKKLFAEKGYENTSVRDIVHVSNTSMGNLYFHFPNKLEILKIICLDFVNTLREQIFRIHDLGLSPAVGFALDFRIGYITTLEHPKISRFWAASRNISEIHQLSLENKRIRLKTFFGNRMTSEDIELMAIAIQGIADGIFEQKREGKIKGNSARLSNTIIDYSLRLFGYSSEEIKRVLDEVEQYIKAHHLTIDEYFGF